MNSENSVRKYEMERRRETERVIYYSERLEKFISRMKLRWGIVCTGMISNDFMMALKCLPEKDHENNFNLSKDDSDMQLLLQHVKFLMPKALLKIIRLNVLMALMKTDDPNIAIVKCVDHVTDVVYVGIINSLHLKISKLMLEHGKNVLCEKPLAMNLREVIEMTDLAKKKNLYLMEAIWSRCFPLYKKLAELITSNYIGDIKFVNCNFGIVTLAFNHEKPVKIAAVGTLNDDDTDTAFSVSMVFPNGGQASIAGSVDVPCDAIIYGTKGTIKYRQDTLVVYLLLQTKVVQTTCQLRTTSGSQFLFIEISSEPYKHKQLHNPFWCAFEMTVNGDKECPWMTHTHSKVIAAIMDEIRSQIGVHFSADDNHSKIPLQKAGIVIPKNIINIPEMLKAFGAQLKMRRSKMKLITMLKVLPTEVKDTVSHFRDKIMKCIAPKAKTEINTKYSIS
ncbi:Trans-1,2-dihydrobenzene-1,2-diol dehydrogenase [Nymphon striatum]|nr:Trans-1,2-dihydrobenzene-1,2-diol dehydrogenase [Nymphon striatum]